MTSEEKYDFDLIVIGGGSGGISAAKEAADLGAKVALFDFVKATNHGTRWGLGGTCVNVGCIPKKLMHYSGLISEVFHDAKSLGWEFDKPTFNWEKMKTSVNDYIRSLNWGYRTQMVEKGIKYHNSWASFIDSHTVEFFDKQTTKLLLKGLDINNPGLERITGKYILLATGGRPWIPDIPGKELGITSDDIFWWPKLPGKTLCVGASYIALENAGFLHSMGFDVEIMVRSILLRGFDTECATFVGTQMEKLGMKFIKEHTPRKLEKLKNGKIRVHYAATKDKTNDNLLTEDYDTVMFATGRKTRLDGMHLEKTGVKVEKNGFINVNNEQTNVKHIFAVGDLVNGTPELTPVAIQAGRLLSRRLFANKKTLMDYVFVCTTVFTPVEYSCCGYSEDEANDVYGEEDLVVYHSYFDPIEHSGSHRQYVNGEDVLNSCFTKVICVKSEEEKIVGFHYCGPHAGEVMQGFGLALKVGVTKEQLDNCVGIHPTTAERFTTMHVTKDSGESPQATGC